MGDLHKMGPPLRGAVVQGTQPPRTARGEINSLTAPSRKHLDRAVPQRQTTGKQEIGFALKPIGQYRSQRVSLSGYGC